MLANQFLYKNRAILKLPHRKAPSFYLFGFKMEFYQTFKDHTIPCSINYSREAKGKENAPLPFMKQI